MAAEYKLSYTASEIDERLGQVDNNKTEIENLSANHLELAEIVETKADADHAHVGQEEFSELEPTKQIAGDYWMLSY